MNAHSQLIHEYIDGSLAPYLEELLFAELSANEALRRDFRSHVSIQRAAHLDAQNITAPTVHRDVVFQHLGLVHTVQPISTAVVTGALSHSTGAVSTLSLSSRVLASLRSPLQGTLLCTAFLLGLFSNELSQHAFIQDSGAQVDHAQLSSKPPRPSQESVKAQSAYTTVVLPKLASRATVLPTLSGRSRSLLSKSASSTITTQKKGKDQTAITNDQGNGNDRLITTLEPSDSPSYSSTIEGAAAPSLAMIEKPSSAIAPFFLDSPWHLELRSSLASARQSAAQFNLDNMALRLFVELDDHTALGIECANDVYAMQRSQRVAGKDVVLRLLENRPTLAALIRQKLLSLQGTELVAFGELALGASASADVLGRTSLGLLWQPEGALSVHCSLGYSALNYGSNNQRLMSNAISLQYGVALHF